MGLGDSFLTYGCSLCCIWLQPLSHPVAGDGAGRLLPQRHAPLTSSRVGIYALLHCVMPEGAVRPIRGLPVGFLRFINICVRVS